MEAAQCATLEGGDEAAGAVAAMPEAARKVDKGMEVELQGQTDGDVGSWYSARVIKVVGKDRALVRHAQLKAEDGRPLDEQVPLKMLRPAPPTEPPKGWLAAAKPGAPLEMQYLNGWWEVSLVKRLPAKAGKPERFKVRADRYDVEHTVEQAALRPGWRWKAGKGKWAYRS